MKRFHVHVAVNDISESIRFYSAVFAAEPTETQADCAKWLLDEPCVSFTISQRGANLGLNHLGIRIDSESEWETLNQRLVAAGLPAQPQKEAAPGYELSDQFWTQDPQGLAWQFFHPLSPNSECGSANSPIMPIKQQRIFNVLFLCTGNSARSIMAEALLNKLGAGNFRAFSAGSRPTGTVNPAALERLALESIPALDVRSKSWEEFSGPNAPVLDFVITVCDNAAGEVCPVWPGQPITAHWGVADPAAVEGDEKRLAFAKAFAVLERRIKLFTSLRPESLARLVLEQQVRDIGQVDAV